MLIRNLPAEAPLYRALREAEAKAEAKERVQMIDDVEQMMRRRSRA